MLIKFKQLKIKYLIISLFSLNAFSQVSVGGVVQDEKTLTPLEDVRIQLRPVNQKGAGFWTGTMTKKNGKYKVTTSMNLPAMISYKKEGCGEKSIKLKEGDKVPSVVYLKCTDKAIKAIIIEQTLDTDGDGLVDKEDKCPKEAGSHENEGCPSDTDDDMDTKAQADKKAHFSLMNKLSSKIFFSLNDFMVSEAEKSKLIKIKNFLLTNPSVKINIEGHASRDGNFEYNIILSEKRASMVKKVLIELGIDSSRLNTKSHGGDKPIQSNSSSQGRSNNRRVEISIQ